MRNPARLAAAAALLVVACALAPGNAGAQGAAPGAASTPAPDAAKPARGRRKAAGSEATKREPTAGQMAGRERQRKCAAEWKEAKAGGKVAAGTKWPQFYSQCNTRLKEQRA